MSRRRADVVADWQDDPWDDPLALDEWEFEKAPRRSSGVKWVVAALLTVVLAVLFGLGALGLWVLRQVNPSGEPGQAVTVVIEPGATINEVSDDLQAKGIISNAGVFRWYVSFKGGLNVQPGSFQVREREQMGEIMKILATRPEQVFTKVTFPEGYTVPQMATRLEQKLPNLKATSFMNAVQGGLIRSELAPDAPNLEGLLFPDTYRIAATENETDVVRRMVDLMQRVARKEGIEEAPQTVFQTPYDVLVIASLIEREAKVPEDRAKIARVIYNRLAVNMPLQIDATVLYAAPGNQTKVTQELIDTTDSPYNTYKVTGLPPTPICNPGRASIRAALNPTPYDKDQSAWLYYVVVDKDGRHAFANTYEEHLANIALAEANGVR